MRGFAVYNRRRVKPGPRARFKWLYGGVMRQTRHKELCEASLNRHGELELLLDNISVHLWCLTAPDTYGAANKAHAAFLGVSPNLLRRKKIDRLLAPEEASVCVKNAELAFAQKTPLRTEEQMTGAAGKKRFFSVERVYSPGAGGAGRVICSATDITERRLAEELLERRRRLERLIAGISPLFISLPPEEIDAWINSILSLIGCFEGVDRSYVFQFDPAENVMRNTHEWCAAGIAPKLRSKKSLPLAALPWWVANIKAGREINISRTADLPKEAGAEKKLLRAQSVLSSLAVPLAINGHIEGFLGFDCVKRETLWRQENMDLIRITTPTIVNAIDRKRADERRRQHGAALDDILRMLSSRGADYGRNVDEIVRLAGKLLKCALAVYGRLDGSQVRTVSRWQPPEAGDISEPEGGLCRRIICSNGPDLFCAMELEPRMGEAGPCAAPCSLKNYAGRKVKSQSGAVIGALCVAHTGPHELSDIERRTLSLLTHALETEEAHRAAGELLQESESRWQFALEGAEDGVWDWNPQTGKVFYSKRWKSMLGYGGAEVGDSIEEWRSRIHPEDKEKSGACIQAHLDGATAIFTNEHRLLCKDGSYKWILERGKVISRSPEGKPLRVIGTQTDISGRKAMETELEEAVARLTALIKNLRSGLMLETPGRKVQFVNQRYCDIFSISSSPEALAGADCAAIAVQTKAITANPDAFLEGISSKIKGGKAALREELCFKDGRVFSQDYIPVYLNDGSFLGHMWKYSDITPQKSLEKIRTELTHHINHELRRPITNQLMALSYLQAELDKMMNADQKQILDGTLESAKEMTHMVEDLLEVTRSETGKLSINTEPTDLAALAKSMISFMKPAAKKSRISLSLEASAPVKAKADPSRVRQVLGNLLDNAFKFTPAGGAIKIRIRRAPGAGKMAEICVSDNGPGIGAADLDKIFDRAYHARNISRKGMKGLGLGLYICKMLVERQGGRIWAESTEGSGSAFYFTLPALR